MNGSLFPDPDFYIAPFIAVMATVTLRAKITVVYIVAVMTTTAGLRCLDFARHRTLVALVTIKDILVRTGQFEFGLVVIEIPRLPATHGMTFLALGTQTTLMDLLIVFLVTGETIRLGILEGRSSMTLLALHQRMTAL